MTDRGCFLKTTELAYDGRVEKQQVISLVRTVLGLAMTLGIALLVIRFVVGIVEPGNPENQDVFRMLGIVLGPIDGITDLMAAPIRMVVDPLSAYLPTRGWFPLTPAGDLVGTVNDFLLTSLPALFTDFAPIRKLLTANYGYWMPGVMDWTLLLAIPLWSWVEHLLNQGLDRMEKQVRVSKRQETEAALARSYGLETGAAVITSRKSKDKRGEEKKKEARQQVEESQQDQAYRTMVSSLKGELSRLQQRVEPLEKIAQKDGLTGLGNRAYFDQTLNLELGNAKKENGFLGLVMIDIDNFKQLNDTLGHAMGDAVLKRVAETVAAQELIPGITYACRYGGEELAVIVTQTSPESFNRYAHTLCYEISTTYFSEAPSLRVTASVGAFGVRFRAENGSHKLSEHDLIQRADALLHQAKHAGKNQVKAEFLN